MSFALILLTESSARGRGALGGTPYSSPPARSPCQGHLSQSLIYVRPLYVQATGANAVPELKKVIVAFGDRIAIRDTFQDALVAVFGDAPETREEGPVTSPLPGIPGTSILPEEVRRLLDDAGRAFAEADAALRRGDPVAYATKVQEGRQAFERAREAAGRATPTPTTALPPA